MGLNRPLRAFVASLLAASARLEAKVGKRMGADQLQALRMGLKALNECLPETG